MNKTILVLAGNKEQFDKYVGDPQKHLSQVFMYASHIKDLFGIIPDKIEITGTFWDLPHSGKMYDLALTRVRKIKK